METSATKPKLLLADDSVTIRKVIEMTFAEENIEVFTANDGESAMLRFVETQPDIVLAHIGLPGTNGYQICEMIKQDETTRHIPVLMLAGSFEPFDEAEAQRVGADGHLTKPFSSVRDVVARVRELLGKALPSSAVEPETEDIEHLYKSSFTQRDEIDEFKTVTDSFADHQMDDEMIETFSPAVAIAESGAADLAASSMLDPSPAESRRFDWSPDAVVTPTDTANAQNAAVEKHSVEQEGSFSHSDPSSATGVAAAPVELPAAEPETFEPEIAEPSPEFIALVAQRVVEKLSDKAIREIAQDAVPRIAEKLMREAFGEGKRE